MIAGWLVGWLENVVFPVPLEMSYRTTFMLMVFLLLLFLLPYEILILLLIEKDKR